MIKVSIIGATGYTGSELLRLLVTRQDIEILYLTSQSYVGQHVTSVFPNLTGFIDQEFVELDTDLVFQESDLVFIGLPHGHAMELAKLAKNYPVRLIDLGADFRIEDTETYEAYYHVPQTATEILDSAIYGLPEKYRAPIRDAKVVANPGCFVTSILLGLMPALANGYIETNSIIIDSKSGMSGAGRKATVSNLLSELQGNFMAYGLGSHRHVPEIEQELSKMAEAEVTIQFTPHLLPIERGIYSTIYANLRTGVSIETIRQAYENLYQDEAFVHLLPEGQIPHLKSIRGTNMCHLQLFIDERTNRLIVMSTLDNLGKGASGQAIQNMNLMFGLNETEGLLNVGLVP